MQMGLTERDLDEVKDRVCDACLKILKPWTALVVVSWWLARVDVKQDFMFRQPLHVLIIMQAVTG